MIDLFFEDVEEISDLKVEILEKWMSTVVNKEGKSLADISMIFCSDEYLLKVNQEYLDHDYFTDIITFDYSEANFVSGDLFISIDRVNENAIDNQVSFLNELHRVMIHGVLHLCGYKDKSEEDEKMMRQKENDALGIL